MKSHALFLQFRTLIALYASRAAVKCLSHGDKGTMSTRHRRLTEAGDRERLNSVEGPAARRSKLHCGFPDVVVWACWDLKLLWQIRHSDQAVGRIPLYVSLYSNLIKFCLLSEENLLSVATLDDSFQSPAFISVQFFCLASCSPSQSDLCVGFFVKQLTRM